MEQVLKHNDMFGCMIQKYLSNQDATVMRTKQRWVYVVEFEQNLERSWCNIFMFWKHIFKYLGNTTFPGIDSCLMVTKINGIFSKWKRH